MFVNKKTYSADEVLELLRQKQGNRTQTELAADMGVTNQYLSDILNRRRGAAGPAVLRYLGLEVGYVRPEKVA